MGPSVLRGITRELAPEDERGSQIGSLSCSPSTNPGINRPQVMRLARRLQRRAVVSTPGWSKYVAVRLTIRHVAAPLPFERLVLSGNVRSHCFVASEAHVGPSGGRSSLGWRSSRRHQHA